MLPIHIDHNAPCLHPKIIHNHCFHFLLGITVDPREIEGKGYAKFWGGKQSALQSNVKMVNIPWFIRLLADRLFT